MQNSSQLYSGIIEDSGRKVTKLILLSLSDCFSPLSCVIIKIRTKRNIKWGQLNERFVHRHAGTHDLYTNVGVLFFFQNVIIALNITPFVLLSLSLSLLLFLSLFSVVIPRTISDKGFIWGIVCDYLVVYPACIFPALLESLRSLYLTYKRTLTSNDFHPAIV